MRNWVSSALDVMEVEGVFQQSDLPPRQARGRAGPDRMFTSGLWSVNALKKRPAN